MIGRLLISTLFLRPPGGGKGPGARGGKVRTPSGRGRSGGGSPRPSSKMMPSIRRDMERAQALGLKVTLTKGGTGFKSSHNTRTVRVQGQGPPLKSSSSSKKKPKQKFPSIKQAQTAARRANRRGASMGLD